MAARIIGEAAVRLRADSSGLAAEMSGIIRKALDKATADAESQRTPLDVIERRARETGLRIQSVFAATFAAVGSMASSVLSAALSGGRLLLLGAAAGAAIPAVGALAAGLIAVAGAASQAVGVVGLLPAVLFAVKAAALTVQLGMTGVSEAFSAIASGDAAAFEESLKTLAPSAREFAREVNAFKPAFDSMRLDVQQRMFAGLGSQVEVLGARYLPIARGMFTNIAGSINLAAVDLGNFLAEADTMQRVTSATENVGGAFAVLRRALVPAVSGLIDLTSVGSQFLPALAEKITALAERFGAFIRSAADSGRLADFFSNAIAVAAQLGRIIGNLASGLGNVFSAGMGQGRGLLGTLEEITASFEEFTGSVEGQQALDSFFGSMSTVAATALPVLRELALLIGGDIAPLLSNLAQGIGPGVLAIIGQLRTTVTALTPGMSALGEAFGRVLTALAPILPTIGQLIGQLAGGLAAALNAAVGPLTTFINYLAESPGTLVALAAGVAAVGAVMGPLSGIIGTLAPKISLMVSNAGGLRAVLTTLTGPVGLVIGLLTALFIGSEDFRNAVLGLLGVVGSLVGQLVSALAPTLTVLMDVVGNLVATLGTALAPVVTLVADLLSTLLPPIIAALTPIIAAVVPIIQQVAEVFGQVIAAVTPFISLLVAILMPAIQALLPVVETVFGVVAEVIGNAMRVVQGVIDVVMGIITGDWSRAWDGLKTIVSGVLDFIGSIISGALSIIGSVIRAAWDFVTGIFRSAWDSIGGAVRNGISNVISFVTGLPGQILSALGNLGSLLLGVGRDLINGLIDGVKAVAGRIKDAVLGPIKDSIEAVKNFLGISSPSKLFRQFGAWTGEGYVLGMDEMTPAVIAAGRAMADAAAGAMGGVGAGLGVPGAVLAGSGAAATAAAGVVLHQTNVMQPGTDVRQFADYANREAFWDLQSNGSLLPTTVGSGLNGVSSSGATPGLGGF